MSINKKAGYEITKSPYEPKSLFDSTPTGDVSECTVDFEIGENETLESGETLSTLFGKIKYFINSVVNKFLPIGGTTGQVLKKASDSNYDVKWEDEGGSSLPENGNKYDLLTKTGSAADAVEWKEELPRVCTYGSSKNVYVSDKHDLNGRIWIFSGTESKKLMISNFRYDTTDKAIKLTLSNNTEENYNYTNIELTEAFEWLFIERTYNEEIEYYDDIEATAVSPFTDVSEIKIHDDDKGNAYISIKAYMDVVINAGQSIDVQIPITGITDMVNKNEKYYLQIQGTFPEPPSGSAKKVLTSIHGSCYWDDASSSNIPVLGQKGSYLKKNSYESNDSVWDAFRRYTLPSFVALCQHNSDADFYITSFEHISNTGGLMTFKDWNEHTGQDYVEYEFTTVDGWTDEGSTDYMTAIFPCDIFGIYPNNPITASVSGDSNVTVALEVLDRHYIQLTFGINSPIKNTERHFTLRFEDSVTHNTPCSTDILYCLYNGYYLSIEFGKNIILKSPV